MGVFDVGVTGVDWLTEHLQRFPGSPVRMMVDLGRSRYKIGPVVDEGFPADSTVEALKIWNNLDRPTIVASEYPALAEAFARDAGLLRSVILPINGASEGFVPEDADILIEGSETGTSIRANKLKMLDPFMESTNCVIVRTEPATSRTDLVDDLVQRFERAAVAAGVA
jgi:ATP phosphoribosyltransferase